MLLYTTVPVQAVVCLVLSLNVIPPVLLPTRLRPVASISAVTVWIVVEPVGVNWKRTRVPPLDAVKFSAACKLKRAIVPR